MYVTKLGFDESRAARALLPGGASKRGVLRSRICAYRFSQLDDLLIACRRLCRLNAVMPSSAYRDDEGAWYLILDETNTPPEQLGFLCEFGTVEDAGRLGIYINEHGVCVRQGDAAKVLGEL